MIYIFKFFFALYYHFVTFDDVCVQLRSLALITSFQIASRGWGHVNIATFIRLPMQANSARNKLTIVMLDHLSYIILRISFHYKANPQKPLSLEIDCSKEYCI